MMDPFLGPLQSGYIRIVAFGGYTYMGGHFLVISKLSELLSKLLISPLLTPVVFPYILPYITPKEFRL